MKFLALLITAIIIIISFGKHISVLYEFHTIFYSQVLQILCSVMFTMELIKC